MIKGVGHIVGSCTELSGKQDEILFRSAMNRRMLFKEIGWRMKSED